MNPTIQIQNSNTVDSTLANTSLSANANPTAEAFACPMDNIAHRLRFVGKAHTGVMQGTGFLTASSLGSNATNFQSGDSALDNAPVTVNHLVKRGHFSAPELGNGLSTVNHLGPSLVREFEKDIWTLAMTVYNSGTFGATDLVSALADFDTQDLESVAKTNAGNPRTALVASGAMPGIANDLVREGGKWVYPLCDGGVYECNLTGSTADVCIVAGPTSLVYVCEKPDMEKLPPAQIQVTEVMLPKLGIPAWRFEWFDRATRTRWISYEAFFGVAAGTAAAMTYSATS